MRIDLGIPVGLGIGFGCIVGSIWLDGGHLGAFLNLSAFLIIGGGTLGAAMVSTTMKDVLRLPRLVHKAIWGWVGADAYTLIGMLVEASVRARKGGVLALEDLSNDPTIDPFLGRGLQLIVDAAEAAYIREVLTSEIVAMERRHQRGIALLESMGGYAPTMGIIGTVLGLVHVLAKLSTGGTEGLGEGIAVAFIATLYGIFSANVLLLPLASNLRGKSREESFRREMVMEGLLGLQASENPHLLEVRLHTYFPVTPPDRAGRRTAGESMKRQEGVIETPPCLSVNPTKGASLCDFESRSWQVCWSWRHWSPVETGGRRRLRICKRRRRPLRRRRGAGTFACR